MSACLVCARPRVRLLLDAGAQPVCNRFPAGPDEPEFLHPMRFGACEACGTAQLIGVAPASELKPQCDWITYNEPEPHLDGLADRIMKLPRFGADSTVIGVSLKDDSLLRRLRERGVGSARVLDVAADLGEPDPRAFVESIQGRLVPDAARRIVARRGAADLVIARHIFEHAHAPAAFLEALTLLLKPGGRILLEAPDCTRALRSRDYSMLWEEHSLYLTPQTFRTAVESAGAAVELFETHPYALEDSMVVVAGLAPAAGAPSVRPAAALAEAEAFAAGLESKRRELDTWSAKAAAEGEKIAVFGAGHLSAVWINLLGLRGRVAFVIDDNPHKTGLRMPGSRLPIVRSDALVREGVKWALMAFHPGSEDAVIAKNQEFVQGGGRFASIFPGSPRALNASGVPSI